MPMPHASPPVDLVADLGATNARFGLASPSGVEATRILRCADHATLAAAMAAYLAEVGPAAPPRRAAIAVASPITGDRITMTNHPWSFSIAETRQRFGFKRLEVVNDFLAIALGLPWLTTEDVAAIGGGRPDPGQPIGVLGPGTGLGVSGLVPSSDGWIPLSGEGGHVTMAARDDREAAILGWLRRRFPHVSAERVLSGGGLVNLHDAIAALDGREVPPRQPHEVTDAALAGTCPVCREAIARFCAMLGTVAGNLALTLGARGGVYIAGGIVPRIRPLFETSEFRHAFEDKGRLSDYVAAMPSYLVIHPVPAFLGLRALLEQPA